jgi:thioredoxin 1
MKNLITAFAFMATLFTYSCVQGHAQSNANQLSPVAFKQKLDSTEKRIILDVRTPAEFKEGHLYYAVNMDWEGDDFDQQIQSLDKNTPVFVYCYGGGRSNAATKELRKQGFREVYDLHGGFSAWRNAGLPEEK